MKARNLTHLDLFSGIGGFALAAQWMRYQTVQFVEWDKFCQKVLAKNFPGVPIHSDIKDFDGTKYAGVDLLTGGFPCQPASCAGRRAGTSDDRWLWPEMLRVIRDAQPEWIVGENVGGLITLEDGLVFEHLLVDLENEGYEVQPIIIPACAVNAPHRRDRVWIVAHAERGGRDAGRDSGNRVSGSWDNKESGQFGELAGLGSCQTDRNAQDSDNDRDRGGSDGTPRGSECALQAQGSDCGADGNANCRGASQLKEIRSVSQRKSTERGGCLWSEHWLEVATRLCRVDDGIPPVLDRVARVKALGNAIVPQVAYEIIKRISI